MIPPIQYIVAIQAKLFYNRVYGLTPSAAHPCRKFSKSPPRGLISDNQAYDNNAIYISMLHPDFSF